jgi:hypothetical protein
MVRGSAGRAAGLATAIFCAMAASAGHSQHAEGRLAHDLLMRPGHWKSASVTGLEIHFQKGSTAEAESTAIVDAVSRLRGQLLSLLGGASRASSLPRAHIFFVGSREEIRRLTGRPLAGFVQSDEPTAVLSYIAGYHNHFVMRHELTHLFVYQLWGTTRNDAWLTEGLAVWAGGPCQGRSPDEITAGALARGAFVPLTRLASSFRDVPEDVAMSEAGSIVGFLIDRDGIVAMRDRWQRGPARTDHPLGADGAAIEAAWLARVKRATPATLDIPRLIREGC